MKTNTDLAVKVVEGSSTEIYVSINDVLIFLLKEMDVSSSQHEKDAYRKVISKLENLRKGVPHHV